MKKNKLLIHKTICINFPRVMMHEKQKSYMILLILHSQKDKTIEIENRSVASGVKDGMVVAGK